MLLFPASRYIRLKAGIGGIIIVDLGYLDITLNYVSVALAALCIIISLIILLSLLPEYKMRPDLNRPFAAFILCDIGYMSTDIVTRLLMGNTAVYAFGLKRILNFLHFSFGPFILAFMTLHLLAYIKLKAREPRGIKQTVLSICAVALLLTIISQFTGMYYIIDENNVYHITSERGVGYRFEQGEYR